jgi:hypothetical protein
MTIHRVSPHRTARMGLVAVAFALTPLAFSLVIGGAVDAAGPTDRLPDLAMKKPTHLVVQASGGRRLLRLETTIVNIGKGPFETRASRRSTSESTMNVSQRIYNTAGGTRVHESSSIAKYAGDGHDHWHVQQVASYELFAPTGTGRALRRGAKVGFCFFDTNPYKLSLSGAPAGRRYQQSGCGKRSSLYVKNGLSVGWSDVYPWNFAWQWIDITHLPSGEYLLKISADPLGQFQELIEGNNCNWTRIRIPKTGSRVAVVGSGSGCVLPGSSAPTPTPTPIPTGRVITPPRPGDEARVDGELLVSEPSIAFVCQLPEMSQPFAALPPDRLNLDRQEAAAVW